MTIAAFSGAYTADRVASLAGVPLNTVYYWARTGLVTPSVSRYRVKRWSYADLLLLRLIEWLRSDKSAEDADKLVPRTSFAYLRDFLERSPDLGVRLLHEGFKVRIDRKGRLVLDEVGRLHIPLGDGLTQGMLDARVDLVGEWDRTAGIRGPNLVMPRDTIRIFPGKLSGEPHVEGTRISTASLAALDRRGMAEAEIRSLYPVLELRNVTEAISLERQLEANLRRVA